MTALLVLKHIKNGLSKDRTSPAPAVLCSGLHCGWPQQALYISPLATLKPPRPSGLDARPPLRHGNLASFQFQFHCAPWDARVRVAEPPSPSPFLKRVLAGRLRRGRGHRGCSDRKLAWWWWCCWYRGHGRYCSTRICSQRHTHTPSLHLRMLTLRSIPVSSPCARTL